MNGDVNGTMEEPMELSIPNSPISKQICQKVTSEDCDDNTNHCENSNNTDTSNNIGSESNNCCADNGVTDSSLSEQNNELIIELELETPKELAEPEPTSELIQNDCRNSHESIPESTTNSHEKSVTSEQHEEILKDKIDDPCTEDSGKAEAEVSTQVIDDPCTEDSGKAEPKVSTQVIDNPCSGKAEPEVSTWVIDDPCTEDSGKAEPEVSTRVIDDPCTEDSGKAEPEVSTQVIDDSCTEDSVKAEPEVSTRVIDDPCTEDSVKAEPEVSTWVIDDPCIEDSGKAEPEVSTQVIDDPCTEDSGKAEPEDSTRGIDDPCTEDSGKAEPEVSTRVIDDPCTEDSGKAEPEVSTQDSNNEADSEAPSGDDELAISEEPRAPDTVSIHSDSDIDGDNDESQASQTLHKTNDIIVLDSENQPGSQNGNTEKPEVQEIESDNDCVVACEEKEDEKLNDKEKTPLRRSSRAIKRKRYNVDVENAEESVEEIEFKDPLHRRNKPIVINDTKALVEMAAKHVKQGNNQKKEPTVVIIDTNSITSAKSSSLLHSKNTVSPSKSALAAQNLYQSIVARGTTVTPISNKTGTNSVATQVTPTPQPVILPSLTDDMFVVEAPSFIVPYVYEKPSLKPFKEFVVKLGKELEEQKVKEKEKEKLSDKIKEQESENEEKERDDEDSVSESKSSQKSEDGEEITKKKKSQRKEQWRRRNAEDDDSWDGESASESDGALSDEEDKIVVKDKTEPIDQIKNVTDLTVDTICSSKTNFPNSMDCTLGKFFINIGLNLVQEFVQTDLLKQQNRKLYKEKKQGQNTEATESSIVQLMNNLEFSKENNAPYVHPQKKCEHCSFKSESKLVMAHHLETPHMQNNMYKCNYCSFEIRTPQDILFHMEAEHNVRGKLERAPSYHQCANCPFEDNGKGKLARHLITCAKKFKPEMNLSPPVDWEPPAKIPKIAKSGKSIMGPYHITYNRGPVGNSASRSTFLPSMPGAYRPRGRAPGAGAPRGPPVHGIPILRAGGAMPRLNSPVLMQNNFPNNKSKPLHQPSISITPLPRQPPPQAQPQNQQSKTSFVICEICDGYIKDLEQLRNHMQWIHKVKIHPKMIYNRPPLNCQKCQFRFFTDQGLERHLLGSHGLVTSSMQEAANKGKDAGRCPVCGRVYQWKLLNHVARDHNLTLKPAHLSYKCTVCTATFGMYKLFENHVYSAHSVVAKRVMDKGKAAAPVANLKPLVINDEITITPQQAKPSTTAAKDE